MKINALKNRNVFIDDVVAGKATYDDLEKYVDQWHDGNGFGVSAYEYLGLTRQQYFNWVDDEDGFKQEFDKMIKSHKIARRISGI